MITVSIHAPTKGATSFASASIRRDLFQSTLPRRERLHFSVLRLCHMQSFNPRSHEGSDAEKTEKDGKRQGFQSTLPRRERREMERRGGNYPRFNPRSHEGSDRLQFSSIRFPARFNPRSHEGSDIWQNLLGTTLVSFNPRSHEGSDLSGYVVHGNTLTVSIHAPTKGAT